MKQPANLFAEQTTQLFRLCQCEMNKDKSTWERGGRKRQAIHEMKACGRIKTLFTIYLSLVHEVHAMQRRTKMNMSRAHRTPFVRTYVTTYNLFM
jgi:hypothetical protein